MFDGSGGGRGGGGSGSSSGGGGHMDVKVVYANPNGTLSILPDTAAGVSPWRPSSVSLAAVYLTLSSAAIASNVMVLTGIVTADRLRSPYAVLVSALCLQCAMDAAVGHYATTRELLTGGGSGGATMCRGVATVTAALSAVELVTFAALACLNTFVRADYAELPLPAAATLWAAPSMYTYVILTPTLLFTTRYFPSRGRCGFIANTTGWFYPSLLIVFSFMIPWSISFYFVFVSRPSTTTNSANVLVTPTQTKSQIDLVPSKLIFASYTILVTPSLISSSVYLYSNPNINPWAENEAPEDILDGFLSKLPILFDVFVPLVLIYYHKVFRKKCRELYLHGFRNSVSDGRQISIERLRRSRKNECLADDAPVLFLERSGLINVRFPSEDGFMMKVCDLNQKEDNNSNGRKEVRFSIKVSKAPNESGIYSTKEPRDEESSL
ncbi:uncharacterized protein LOC100571075 [Acyrthosiphon pisum]|uniref:Uncharacterized protein n=1 Tax=Acyrthosiphon pisum TaxID=7029 RepID=A0A8R2AZ49_ACYPI|nr:uncharacterized protein LOC100571075 [Acyrthosiphon pisum]|eukprot:XP_008180184.2 PREDICTED: uncharacterized protein LOC100571075 [Acyrthosiphon pisum]